VKTSPRAIGMLILYWTAPPMRKKLIHDFFALGERRAKTS